MTDRVSGDATFAEAAKLRAQDMLMEWMGDFVDGRLQIDLGESHDVAVSKAEKLMEGISEGKILVTTQADKRIIGGGILYHGQINGVAIPVITIDPDFARIALEEHSIRERFIRHIAPLVDYFERNSDLLEGRGVRLVNKEEWQRLHGQK